MKVNSIVCPSCGASDIEAWQESAYSDDTEDPSCTNKLITVDFKRCRDCGEEF